MSAATGRDQNRIRFRHRLREIARKNMNISEGTVVAKASNQQIATAKLIQHPKLARELAKSDAIHAITPMQSAAITMQDAVNATQSAWRA